jgi:glycosyltransferase involved in cell wall biosynthesis
MPAHNEANSIERVIREYRQQVVGPTGADFLVCEDGSTDGTDRVLSELAAQKEIRLLSDRGRKGYGEAIRDALRTIETPLTFFADSDGQYDARDFWKLWPHAGEYDMIIGQKLDRDEPFHRILLSRGFHVLVKTVTNVPLKDMDCGFRIIRKTVVDAIVNDVGCLPYSFWAEFSILAYRRGFRVLEVPVTHRARLNGTTSIYNPRRLPMIVALQALGLASLGKRLRQAETEK